MVMSCVAYVIRMGIMSSKSALNAPEEAIQFIISEFYDQVVTLSTHPHVCHVIQRIQEHCSDPKTQRIVIHEVLQSVSMLAQDQYGNYDVQHVLEHVKPHEWSCITYK
ncbi:hypothetical protein RHGRI_020689 [Rhododendron griersonianum]|uniref:PUM-HD domain-containing protein n=1 Tax=Rhododendron griersonianum TaxID=479676 RepID=A0AAV6JL93_9ERIC|nr:hypothetical protein RHGRI_020689 [Rhododendron griersonianum]